jgi:adhesin transport system membrane fusion protein
MRNGPVEITASSIAIDDRVTRTTVTRCAADQADGRSTPRRRGTSQAATWWEIVPLEDNLPIEASTPTRRRVPASARKAMVKFSAYDYTIYEA